MAWIEDIPVVLDDVRIGTAVLHENGNFEAKLDQSFIDKFMALVREDNIEHVILDPVIKPARPAEPGN